MDPPTLLTDAGEIERALAQWYRGHLHDGGAVPDSFHYWEGSHLRRVTDYHIHTVAYRSMDFTKPELKQMFCPTLRMFVGHRLTYSGVHFLNCLTVPDELNECAVDDAGGVIRCVLASRLSYEPNPPAYMRTAQWVRSQLARPEPDDEFINWLAVESGIENPVTGLNRLIKTRGPDKIKEMLDIACRYVFPDCLIGKALNHLCTFKTL